MLVILQHNRVILQRNKIIHRNQKRGGAMMMGKPKLLSSFAPLNPVFGMKVRPTKVGISNVLQPRGGAINFKKGNEQRSNIKFIQKR